jgi:hypothetical protein
MVKSQGEMHEDIKGLRSDVQNSVVQNTKDIALLNQRVKQLYDERPLLFKVISYKNRVIGALGIIAFVLVIYGLDIFKVITIGGK